MTRFLEYADQGFAVLFVGGLPNASPYYSADSDLFVVQGVQRLLTYPSVRSLGSEAEVVGALDDLGISPAARNLAPCPILYVHRWDADNAADYYWVYNSDLYQSHATGASLKGSGVPYALDPWAGVVTPILNYTSTGGRFNLWFDLKSNQSTIVAFAPEGLFPGVTIPRVHVTSSDIEYLNISSDGNDVIGKTTQNISHVIVLSDGRNFTCGGRTYLPSSFELGPWNLTIQDWQPGPDPWANYSSVFTYHHLVLRELIPWYNITGLENTSGIGTYETQFAWAPKKDADTASGAFLDLGPVLNAVKLWVNGQWTGPIDVTDAVVDIGSYLVNGLNQVKIETPSTLRNRLLQVNITQSWEEAEYSAAYGRQPYGLAAPVTLIPYREIRIPV